MPSTIDAQERLHKHAKEKSVSYQAWELSFHEFSHEDVVAALTAQRINGEG